jgi:GntR family transcriptional repressor for pyruvate dehydrogenase complex
MSLPLTDQAIAKIKELIISGEFKPASKLPREQDLAARLGLSRNSLREAVRALALIGVLDTRVGDGTYVTSLDADALLTGMGFIGELLDPSLLLEVSHVRRILEPVATGQAATRLTEDDFLALEACLTQMDEAETTEVFIAADTEFHRIIVLAAGNATLASVIQSLSGGMLRSRLWRAMTDHGAIEITRQRHRDIYAALREGNAERASAADFIHLSESDGWLRRMVASGEEHEPSASDGVAAGDSRPSVLASA